MILDVLLISPMADPPCAAQHRFVVELKQAIHILPPIVERQILAFLGAQFGLFQKDHHQPVQGVNFIGLQIVFRHAYIGLAYPRTGPRGEAMLGALASARAVTISAAVWPVTA